VLRNGLVRNGAAPIALLVVALSVATLAAACSSSNSGTTNSGSGSPSAVTTSPPASPTGGTGESALAGSWSGSYSGAFSGTFKLTWTQNGSKLNGTIHLNPGGTEPINGTVTGSNIQFGTVGGSQVITYTGTVSGDSMSGTYKVKTANGSANGSWNAHKTS
jgi:hypothetical protein